MEPFTSNDTYACPDCGSEVKVGARSCPGCGPFEPVEWSEEDINQVAMAFHSLTTYTDNRELLEKSRRPVTNPVAAVSPENSRYFQAVFFSTLIILILIALAGGALKLLHF